MKPAAAIDELAKLLVEEGRVEERIRQTQAALADIKKTISESIVRRYVERREEKVPVPEELLREEQSYEHLCKALLEMKNEIGKGIRAAEERIVQANADHLKESFEHGKNKLSDCMAAIDKRILECRVHIEEYERIRSDLNAINEGLFRLGKEALPMPDPLPTTDVGEIITGRIHHLRSHGKI